MLPIPMPSQFPSLTTVWMCPHEHCEHRELGYPDAPLGDGVCPEKTTPAHPQRRLVLPTGRDAGPGGRGLRRPQEGR